MSDGSAVFEQLTAESLCTLQWAAPFLPQNCPFAWRDLDFHLIDGSLSRPETTLPSGISIGSGVFCSADDDDTLTDRQTTLLCVTIGCIYVVLLCNLIIVKFDLYCAVC